MTHPTRPEVVQCDSAPPAVARPGPIPILYSFRRCPYAMRARLALAASGQIYELREVALRDKPPELLMASPKGTVPVLVLPGGEVIDESLPIMLWALNRHDPMQWLGHQEAQLDDSLALIAQCDGPFKQHLDAYKYAATGHHASQARQQASEFVQALNQRLACNAYLSGPQMCLADAAIVPFVRQFAGVQPEWFAQQAHWQAVRGWLACITASALFCGVMQKQAPWQTTLQTCLPTPLQTSLQRPSR